ncbi:transposase [Promicromonospora umidemergens]|uniref:transposase n=1 Tax=Promicromonospora umidemergens TaxID=629679 RepID=UPI003CD07674
MDAAGRHDLTDEAWAVVGPLLPVAACGRPARYLRRQVDGIRHRVRAGCPWRDVPDRYGRGRGQGFGPVSSVSSESWLGESMSGSRSVAEPFRGVRVGLGMEGEVQGAIAPGRALAHLGLTSRSARAYVPAWWPGRFRKTRR